MVFTTKHHDGFACSISYTDFKSRIIPMEGRCQQLADACQRKRYATWFYYSPPDMHHSFRDTAKLAKKIERGARSPSGPCNLEYMRLQFDRAADEIRPGRFDLVRRFASPGENTTAIASLSLSTNCSLPLCERSAWRSGDYQTPEQFIPNAIRRRACVLRRPIPAFSKN